MFAVQPFFERWPLCNDFVAAISCCIHTHCIFRFFCIKKNLNLWLSIVGGKEKPGFWTKHCPMTIFKDKRTRLLVVRSPCWYTVNTNKTTKEICTICDLVKLRKLFGKRSVRTVTYTFDFFIRQWLKEFIPSVLAREPDLLVGLPQASYLYSTTLLPFASTSAMTSHWSLYAPAQGSYKEGSEKSRQRKD